MIDDLGRGLVFLLSQPRAGSTLLQRILGAHPQIHTKQEPSIALYPLYGLRDFGHEAEYRVAVARLFQNAFLQELPDGEETYVEALRLMLSHLYNAALAGETEKRLFLDKTPRYYFIIPELARVFPAARYIILLRNPLAVLSSILTTWVRGEWLGLGNARHDLLEAPSRLLAGRDLLGERAITVHYEALVRQPEEVVPLVCRHLEVDYVPAMISYEQADLPRWEHADQRSIYSYRKPEPHLVDRWQDELAHPQIWRLAGDYLTFLGPEILASLGYDSAELAKIIAGRTPALPARWFTFPLLWLARRPPPERALWERRLVRLVRRFILPYPRQNQPAQDKRPE